jgi:Tfp pilus assembly protein PilF
LEEKYPAAANLLEQIIRSDSTTPGNYFFLAMCYDKMSVPDQAYANYQKFLELDQGKNDIQDFQARQRMRILEKRRKK